MTQAEGHRSFDLRLAIDCSLPHRRIDRLSAGPCSAGVAVGFACSGLEGRRIGRPALPSRWPSRPRRRALPSEGRGREFESRRVRQLNQRLKENCRLAMADRGSAGEAARTISRTSQTRQAQRTLSKSSPRRHHRLVPVPQHIGWLVSGAAMARYGLRPVRPAPSTSFHRALEARSGVDVARPLVTRPGRIFTHRPRHHRLTGFVLLGQDQILPRRRRTALHPGRECLQEVDLVGAGAAGAVADPGARNSSTVSSAASRPIFSTTRL